MKSKITRIVKEDGWTEERELIKEGSGYDVFLIWNSDMGPKPTLVQSLINKFTGRDNRMRAALNKNGDYIGDPREAKEICEERGIAPEMSNPENSVCSIGYCAREEKWYGWSHRAIAGFGIGDKIYDENYEGDPHADRLVPEDHGSVTANTLEDAKLSAIRYAEDVS